MYFLLDILIISIYVLIIWYFKNKGFLKASETVVSLIVTFSLMPVFSSVFGDFIDNSSIGQGIHKKVELTVAGKDNAEEMIILPDVMQENLLKAENMK
ncbi:MAG: hypothetical protein Q4G23_12675, partial [Clostridia bacterium]|nr:hypothetical protein [Clostridia bacterium]